MTYQAIATRFFGPTNTRGSRVKATSQAGSIALSWRHELNSEQNHDAAAEALARKFGWCGAWYGGGSPDGRGNVYVWVPKTDRGEAANAAFYVKPQE